MLKYDDYMNTEETAKFIGVTRQTVEHWRKKGWLMPDVIGHGKNGRGGVYYYSKERILQLASVYVKPTKNAYTSRTERQLLPAPVVEENANETDGSETVDFDNADQHEQETISQPLANDDVPATGTSNDVPDAPTAAAQIDKPAADVPVEVVDKQTRIDAAKQFFDLLFGKITAPHFSYLIKFSGGANTYAFTVADETQRADMARKAVELSDMGVDIWHAVNPVSVEPKGGKRGKEDVVSYQTAVIADIDIRSEAHKGDPAKLAADFNEAKSFLPFPPSIIVDSGFGMHAYYLFGEPLAITDDNREEIKRRNNRLLDVIRAKAAGKLIDGVGDLPRILRTPGTKNFKLGEDNAPLCHVVEVNDIRFTPADLDARLDALTPVLPLTTPPEPARAADSKSVVADRSKVNTPRADDDPDLKDFRIRHMLPCINVVDGEYNKWTQVGMGLYNEGLTCADWEQWSRTQPDFKEGECAEKWTTFAARNDGIKIGTLYQWAVEGGYDEKTVQREYYQLHPEKSKKHDTAAQIEQLKADLVEVSKKLKEFDDQKNAALERLKTVETFDSATVFADDVIEAAAFAKRYDLPAFSDLRRAVKLYGDKHPAEKANVNSWVKAVSNKDDALEATRHALAARATDLRAQINSLTFIAADDSLRGVKCPDGYEISGNGIWRVEGESMIQVCCRAVIFRGIAYEMDEKPAKIKWLLSYRNPTGKWRPLPAQYASTAFDARKIVGLADYNLPVTSSNAQSMIAYLDAFRDVNETALPITYTVGRGGWYEFHGQEIFVDPRRKNVVTHDGKSISVVVDSNSQFANALRSKGSLAEWKRAYEMAKTSPVARAIVAAFVAPPLLKVLGERNFWVHINAPTRAGKTTALLLGATAVGSEKIIRSFDGTKNGLTGAAADVNDYVFAIDEKQVADQRISGQFGNLIYSLANGIGRTKLKRDSTPMEVKEWRTITLSTGETELPPDNATGGADTRLLPINVPKYKDKDKDEVNVILPADTCKSIRHIVADNYGHALTLVIDKIIAVGKTKLRDTYQKTAEFFMEKCPDVLPEHCRYVAVLTLADALLNAALGTDDANEAYDDAIIAAKSIFPLIPTAAEIDDTAREKDFVVGFIAQNVSCFIDREKNTNENFMPKPLYGLLNARDGYSYIIAAALRDACKNSGRDYRKLVADLIAVGFFAPSDKIKKGHKTPLKTVQKTIGKVKPDCYRIPNEALNSEE